MKYRVFYSRENGAFCEASRRFDTLREAEVCATASIAFGMEVMTEIRHGKKIIKRYRLEESK